jgi:hypothetical protein
MDLGRRSAGTAGEKIQPAGVVAVARYRFAF